MMCVVCVFFFFLLILLNFFLMMRSIRLFFLSSVQVHCKSIPSESVCEGKRAIVVSAKARAHPPPICVQSFWFHLRLPDTTLLRYHDVLLQRSKRDFFQQIQELVSPPNGTLKNILIFN